MQYIVLDTHVIVADPTILARSRADLTLVVPVAVLEQLRQHPQTRLTELVIRAAGAGNIKIDGATDTGLVSPDVAARIGETDRRILCVAIDYKNRDANTFLATTDQELHVAAQQHNVQTIDSVALRTLLYSRPSQNAGLLSDTRRFAIGQKIYAAISVLVGVGATLLFQYLIRHADVVLPKVVSFSSFAGLAAVGIVVFWLRNRFRMTYGCVESGIGAYTAKLSATPALLDPVKGEFEFLKLVGGLYVVVRGMDNIDKGIDGHPWEVHWRKLFKKSK